jgi:type I restriction enzyme S subunit
MSFPRYPHYKDSGVEWLGEVPGHWEVVQFKQFVDIQNGSDHKHVEQTEGYPVLGSGGVFTYASDFLYDGESVLLGRKGTIDKPLHITGRFWTVDTMYWTKINPAASGRFTYYSALTIPFDYYSTNTALPSMTKGALSSHLVARPPLPEQTQIAAFLDRETAKIDELVAEQRRLMALLKEKRQAVISHAVTRGLNPHAPLKPSGIEWLGDVPAHWDCGGLTKFIGPIVDYRGRTPVKQDCGVFLVTARNIKNGKIDYDASEEYVDPDSAESLLQRGRPEIGDLLFTMEAPLGQVALIDRTDIALAQRVVKFRGKPNVMRSSFLLLWLMSEYCQAKLLTLATGSTALGIKSSKLGMIECLVPPYSEQAEIVAFIDCESIRMDRLICEAQRAIDLLQERRTALISAAVTGQIDVRGVGLDSRLRGNDEGGHGNGEAGCGNGGGQSL